MLVIYTIANLDQTMFSYLIMGRFVGVGRSKGARWQALLRQSTLPPVLLPRRLCGCAAYLQTFVVLKLLPPHCCVTSMLRFAFFKIHSFIIGLHTLTSNITKSVKNKFVALFASSMSTLTTKLPIFSRNHFLKIGSIASRKCLALLHRSLLRPTRQALHPEWEYK